MPIVKYICNHTKNNFCKDGQVIYILHMSNHLVQQLKKLKNPFTSIAIVDHVTYLGPRCTIILKYIKHELMHMYILSLLNMYLEYT